MKRFISICSASLFALALCANVVTYTADDLSIFPNPERGFTEELGGETLLSTSKNHVVRADEDWFSTSNQSLVMLMYYLGNYTSKYIPDTILSGFDGDMQILRDKGFKCVLRFAYSWKNNNDADTTWVKRHIAQIKPHLQANADVIYVLETGFVGRWGEWYYSSNYSNETQHMNKKRKVVLNAMLDACPANRFLLVRYPMIKTEYLGDEVALTAAEAYTNTPRAKIGYHNDAFLNDWGNDGTYASSKKSDDPKVRQYIAAETLYVPNGGETNVEDDNLAAEVYDDAESEMSTYHWSFCGSSYATEITGRWRSSGIYDELNRKMGYRYQLITATLPQTVEAGHEARFQLQLRNVGYAPLYNERHAYIVLRDEQSTYRLLLQSDPRTWLPNGAVTTIDDTLMVPMNVPAGTYQLYLHMPDASPSLEADPRYAVRFANTDVWDPSSGMNSLQSTLTVTAQGQGHPYPKTASQVYKTLRNGQLIIRKNGKTYTAQGIELF